MSDPTALAHFTHTAEQAANQVISAYSTSFGLACHLLGPRHRQHVRNIYALVRVADELVDGMTAEAGLAPQQQRDAFERFVDETHLALTLGCSSDLIVHAFARTAHDAGIDQTLTAPFFASMRTDLQHHEQTRTTTASPAAPVHDAFTDRPAIALFTPEQHADYVYGSAEAVGLMCLRVFLRDETRNDDEAAVLEHGARQLGAAFQNINFLRDLSDDTYRLHRSYLGVDGWLSEVEREKWVQVIRTQLDDADAAIPLLPRDARAAVRSARALFGALTDRVAAATVDDLYTKRIRVPNATKAALAARAAITTRLERGA